MLTHLLAGTRNASFLCLDSDLKYPQHDFGDVLECGLTCQGCDVPSGPLGYMSDVGLIHGPGQASCWIQRMGPVRDGSSLQHVPQAAPYTRCCLRGQSETFRRRLDDLHRLDL